MTDVRRDDGYREAEFLAERSRLSGENDVPMNEVLKVLPTSYREERGGGDGEGNEPLGGGGSPWPWREGSKNRAAAFRGRLSSGR